MSRVFFSVVVVFCFGLLYPMALARAQDASESATPVMETTTAVNLTISPVTIQLETDPGKPVSSQIKIRNNGQSVEKLHFSLLPFEADRNGDRPKMRDPRPDDRYLSWVSFDQKSITISPSEWKTVSFTFAPPQEAALSYYFAIQIERDGVARNPGETVISGKPAVLVLANVRSPFAKRELKLSSFKASKGFLEFLPQSFSVDIENSGNIYAMPTGNIFIDGQGKKDIAVLSLNPNASQILPGSTRRFLIDWEDGFPVFKTGKDEQPGLKFDFAKADRLRFGRYTAHLLLVYDNGERDIPVESFVSFWVIPVRFILAIFLIPTVPALIVYLIMRRQTIRARKLTAEGQTI